MGVSFPPCILIFHLIFHIFATFVHYTHLRQLTPRPLFINISSNWYQDPRLFPLSLIFEGSDRHDHLRHLYTNRERIFQNKEIADHLKNYFGLTLENLEEHVVSTMEEQLKDNENLRNEQPVWVDANYFKGAPETFKLPLDVSLSLLSGDGLQDIKPLEHTEFNSEFERRVYDLYQQAKAMQTKEKAESELEKFIDLYNKVGSYEYEIVDGELYYYTDAQPLKRVKVIDQHEEFQKKIELMSKPTKHPSFIDPIDNHIRTGRDRALQRKRDSGLLKLQLGALQKKRWKMDVPPEEDIPRGKFMKGHPLIQKFVDSVDYERKLSNAQDTNYFKANFLETGNKIPDRTFDSYFDIQFIGTPDAYPAACEPDMTFTWPVYWVPWLSKKHPRRRGQPIKSPVFNLGGIEPMQLWFYPEGTAISKPGYCSMKLVIPPGWNLPYRIYLYIFSEYNKLVSKPMYKESKDYVAFTMNSARLLPKKGIDDLLENPKDNEGYVILGPAGNVYIGVGIVDEPIPETDFRGVKRDKNANYKYKYDWHDGHYHMHKWYLKQTADPEDEEIYNKYNRYYTHSLEYQPFKYYFTP